MVIEREFSEVHSAFRTEGKKKLTARKVFYEMIANIDSSIDAILIFRYDRAARLDKEFILLQEVCTRYGVEIISITESFGREQGPISNFLVRNSVNLSQLYSEELSFKCKLGMRRAMLEGKLPGSRLPYGYVRTKKNTATLDTSVAAFVREAFDLYATGKHTFESVATALAAK
jgi:site-specific DNA recombinase